MFIRLATKDDYCYISHALASKAIDYNKPSQAKADIAAGRLYVLVEDGKVIAQCALVEERDFNSMKSGERKTVTFGIGRNELGYYDKKGEFLLEVGDFDLYVGENCLTDRFVAVRIL